MTWLTDFIYASELDWEYTSCLPLLFYRVYYIISFSLLSYMILSLLECSVIFDCLDYDLRKIIDLNYEKLDVKVRIRNLKT